MVTAVTDPTAAATSSTAKDSKTLSANYSTFLNLLTAQIKNQDPLSPMDTTEWTSQLVQYSSVEQQLKANTYLEKLANAADSGGGMNTAVNYIGKRVSAATDTATLSAGKAAWDYTLGGDASDVTLSVLDSKGNTVWSGPATDMSKGSHSVVWDGTTSSGTKLTGGDYSLKIVANNAAGSVAASVSLTGTATSAEVRDGSVVLNVGGTYVPLSAITKVS